MVNVVATSWITLRMQEGTEMKAVIPQQDEELAHREADGIGVSLLWNPADDGLTVVCTDSKRGDSFALAAEPAIALDVFNHPYAYAAQRRVSYSVPAPAYAEPVAA